jgi:hypothetical protein
MVCSMKIFLGSVTRIGAMITLLTGTAFSQSIILPTNKKEPRSAEELEQEKANERAYKRAIEKIPAPEKKATDPWGNIRSSPPTASKAKQRQ